MSLNVYKENRFGSICHRLSLVLKGTTWMFDKCYYCFVDAPFARENDFLLGQAASYPSRWNDKKQDKKQSLTAPLLAYVV